MQCSDVNVMKLFINLIVICSYNPTDVNERFMISLFLIH
jgi:hypothetical protein